MNWIKLQTEIFSSPEYILAEPTDRATWMALMVFCAKNENHGTIVNCRDWKDRTWQQLAAVTLAEVNHACELFRWVGNSLTVKFYPSDTEQLLKNKREASAKGHQAKAANVELPQSQDSQCQTAESGIAATPATTEVLALQSRVDKSRVDKSRTEQTPEAREDGGEDNSLADFYSKENKEFSEWYALYPKKIGEISAQREWCASSHQRPPLGEMVAILGQHIASQEWQAEDGKYIPRPESYLNGQRWRDKLTPGKPIPKPKPPKLEIQVNEEHALKWRKENYPLSVDRNGGMQEFPFRMWPKDIQKEYLNALP